MPAPCVPTAHIMTRVLAISTNGGLTHGSCYAHPHNGHFVLITAGHVIDSLPENVQGELHIFRHGLWERHQVTPHYDPNGLDLAVIETDLYVPAGELPSILNQDAEADIGQDLYFLGFPEQVELGLLPMEQGFPIAFAKKATFASIIEPVVYLDGHANRGFSGGPLVFWDYRQNEHRLLGTVSSYINHNGEIVLPSGETLAYPENSGIGVAVYMTKAIELINSL